MDCQAFKTVCRSVLVLALAVLLCGPAVALDGEPVRVSGFGTLGYSRDNRPDIAPSRDISQVPVDSFATGASWKLDSRIGAQFEYRPNSMFDLVAQVVLSEHFHNDLDSSTELAYLAVKPTAELTVRLGRVNYDAFLMSDHRNVGYAYHWVRPPAEFYGWIPIFSVNGMDAAYSLIRGDSLWRFKAQVGSSKQALPIGSGYEFTASQLLGASVSRESGPWRLKAAYSQFTVGSEVPAFAPLHQGLDAVAAAAIPQVSAEAADLRANLTFGDAKISYVSLGAAFDDGIWLGQTELGLSKASSDAIPHARMAYLAVGRRFGHWTPYLLLGASRPGNDVRVASNNWGALNATLRDPALFTLNATRIEQDSLTLGVRWDFRSNAALKLHWSRSVIKPSGYGLWWRDMAINSQTSSIHQLSATVDFGF